MSLLELRVVIPDRLEETVSTAFDEAGALAIILEDARDEPLFEPAPGSIPLWSRVRLRALFPEEGHLHAALRGLPEELRGEILADQRIVEVEDRDWQRECQRHFSPQMYGQRLWVGASWHPPPASSLRCVVLDPGLAFGTGTHATTAMCLEWLVEQDLERATVIDYGCGSGILAIAAARLGAGEVWAVDVDSQALRATRSNAALNQVQSVVHAVSPTELPDVRADALVANILANTLLMLAPEIATRLRPGGHVALSGILAAQATEVEQRYRCWLRLGPRAQRDEWARLQGVRL
jgi:ribosomal protein L11 methyltransferase